MKKTVFKKIGEFLLSVLKDVNWQKMLYEMYHDSIRSKLLELVNDTESKIDDVIFNGIDKLVETYLKPEEENVE